MHKVALVIFTDLEESHADLGRVVNGLQIAREFKEAGDDVKMIFDGGGVASLAAIVQPEHRLHGVYERIEDLVVGACAYCSKAFEVKEQLEKAEIPLLTDYRQHPSIRSFVVEGYQLITI